MRLCSADPRPTLTPGPSIEKMNKNIGTGIGPNISKEEGLLILSPGVLVLARVASKFSPSSKNRSQPRCSATKNPVLRCVMVSRRDRVMGTVPLKNQCREIFRTKQTGDPTSGSEPLGTPCRTHDIVLHAAVLHASEHAFLYKHQYKNAC